MVFRRDKLAEAIGDEKAKAGHILILDDEPDNLQVLGDLLGEEYYVHKAASGMEGLRILEREPIAMVITDQRMPEMTGAEFLAQSIYSRPECIKIVLTGYADIDAIVAAINRGRAHAFLRKPWDTRELLIAVRNGFEIWRTEERRRALGATARDSAARLRAALDTIDGGLTGDALAAATRAAREIIDGLTRAAEEPPAES